MFPLLRHGFGTVEPDEVNVELDIIHDGIADKHAPSSACLMHFDITF